MRYTFDNYIKYCKSITVINKLTGKEIPNCTMADDITGEYEALETDRNGKVIEARDDSGRRLRAVFRIRGRGDIEVILNH